MYQKGLMITMFLSPARDSPDLSQWKRIGSLTDAVINSINFFCVCLVGGRVHQKLLSDH